MTKRLVVLGAGESGIGAAILALRHGYDVFVSDAYPISIPFQNTLKELNVEWESGQHSRDKIFDADIIVKSPGISPSISLMQEIKSQQLTIVSEIEFASRYTSATLIGITGSNGKTTTAMLLYHILKSAGKNVELTGNIGTSFAKSVAQKTPDYFVIEISSFQLEDIDQFHPHFAVLTNLTPDHLDRYNGSYQKYYDTKFKLAKNQTPKDFFIYDDKDHVVLENIKKHQPRAKLIAIRQAVNNNIIELNNQDMIATITTSLIGKHNAKNAMAAATVAQLINIRKETIKQSLQTFHGAPHRLEQVLRILKVDYINDSKATNVNATYYALDSMSKSTVWIVGGQDKGNDYTSLLPLVREKVKAVICLGIENAKIIDMFAPVVDVLIETQTMTSAVQQAYKMTSEGDAVLLSPACASFDLFKNYEDRGNQFKAAVRQL